MGCEVPAGGAKVQSWNSMKQSREQSGFFKDRYMF